MVASSTPRAEALPTHLPKPSDLFEHWQLDPDIVHLNHGSFGACPARVLEAQRAHRDRMERDAVSFFAADLHALLDPSREAVAPLLNVPAETVVFVNNATQGVLTGLLHAERVGFGRGPLGSGDEILIPEHEYPACRNNAEAIAARCGATVRYVPLGIPTSPIASLDDRVTADALFERIMAGVNDRTRVCLLSLVTSVSGLRLPVERLVPALRARGVETILDGAHGVGCVPIDLTAWQPAFFTSNAHKWLCAPKGAAVLWARDDVRPHVRPVVLSNKANAPKLKRSKWQTEFDYTGTDDPTAWIAVTDAVRTVQDIAGCDWDGIMRRNHDLALAARAMVCEALGLVPIATDGLIGPMVMMPLTLPSDPDKVDRIWNRPARFDDALADVLLDRYRISIPVVRPYAVDGHRRRGFRFSAQLYNAPEQYGYLAECLIEALADEARL